MIRIVNFILILSLVVVPLKMLSFAQIINLFSILIWPQNITIAAEMSQRQIELDGFLCGAGYPLIPSPRAHHRVSSNPSANIVSHLQNVYAHNQQPTVKSLSEAIEQYNDGRRTDTQLLLYDLVAPYILHIHTYIHINKYIRRLRRHQLKYHYLIARYRPLRTGRSSIYVLCLCGFCLRFGLQRCLQRHNV